ncbi:hypothetical protein BABA_22743 [Neobacillus bataviensis LMG 21833]|uniref:HupE / UreJ protein n=1 Tax=Neobacillus bataviensis LMG 21833 TaxID=1117379 RepID=K6C0R6_9BACI|nr:HupE/UreJ family protein [Neobacillus bataviensis]EKN64755.1 hypothetical protein BABA_22743 [Neobacillus bataviensis LMG 21833]
MVKKWLSLIVFLLAFSGLNVPVSFAHTGDSQAYSDISERDDVLQYILRVDMAELRIAVTPNDPEIGTNTPEVINQFVKNSKPEVETYLLSNIKLHGDGIPLEGKLTRLQAIEVNNRPFAEVILEYSQNHKPEYLALTYDMIFDDVDQWHTNFVTINHNGKNQNSVITYESREIQLGQVSFIRAIKQFFLLGVEHLITGYDHILFLLGLLIGARSIKQILKVVTAFTAAHTVTLILASMHIIMLPERFVESLIALSIIYVAINNVFNRNMKHNIWLAFGFGLIHGFGFAGSLSEMRMDGGHFMSSLLTFNLGIEMGQILFVLAIYPVIHYIRRVKWSIPAISASISLFGAVWFIQRAFF